MTIQNEINEIKRHLDIISKINVTQNRNYEDTFKYGLISKIQQAGGTFNSEIKDNNGEMNQKKFFAFKFDPKGDIENQILYQMQNMFKIVDQHRIDELSAEWQDIEFNVAKLENLRDRDTFTDLYRGIIYFKRKQEENNGN